MRTLSFAQVRTARLPAHLNRGLLAYEYRPAFDSVAVFFGATRRPCLSLSYQIPTGGWLHEPDCVCSYCQAGQGTSEPWQALGSEGRPAA